MNARVLLSVEAFFDYSYYSVHSACKQAEDKRRRHNKVKLEYLTAVNYQVAESSFGNDVFAHYRAYPGKPYGDFQRVHKRGEGGGHNQLAQRRHLACAHRTHKQKLRSVHCDKARKRVHYTNYNRNDYGHKNYRRVARAYPYYYQRTQSRSEERRVGKECRL